jgi:CubicO group peptidase (beta-lactamase class C family)
VARSGAAQQASDAAIAAAVDSIANSAVLGGEVAGMSVAVERNGKTIIARGYGLADREAGVKADSATVYRIGSITKQFTAAAVMKLVEEGKIRLDEPIQTYLPGYPTGTHRVLVRHLLNHTSGIRSYTALGPRWFSRSSTDLPTDSIIAMFRDEPFDFAPGADFRYNNSGYFLLGRIIENVSGKSYAEFVTERFFRPLALGSTSYCPNEPARPRHAVGYNRGAQGLGPSRPISMTHPYAAGALCSNVLDLLRWWNALEGGRVVSLASYRAMTTPDTLTGGRPMRYAYGLSTGDLGTHKAIAHGGGINGFVTYLGRYPADSLTVVVLTNTEGPAADRSALAIARIALNVPAARPMPVSAAERKRYVGSYTANNFTVAIREDGEGLIAQATGQAATQLTHRGNGRFTAMAAPGQVLVFHVEGDKAVRLAIEVEDKAVWTGSRAD